MNNPENSGTGSSEQDDAYNYFPRTPDGAIDWDQLAEDDLNASYPELDFTRVFEEYEQTDQPAEPENPVAPDANGDTPNISPQPPEAA